MTRRDPPDSNDDDDVGYGKPPKAGRFQPGQSGNPSGPRRSSNNELGAAAKILNQKITIVVGGKSKRVTLEEAILWQTIQKALEGDKAAIREVFRLKEQIAKLRKEQGLDDEKISFTLIIENPRNLAYQLLYFFGITEEDDNVGWRIKPDVLQVLIGHFVRRPLTDAEIDMLDQFQGTGPHAKMPVKKRTRKDP